MFDPALNAHQLVRYCPIDGAKLTIMETSVEDVKFCPQDLNHTVAFYPTNGEHGEQVMIFDPVRANRMEGQRRNRGV